MSRSVNRVTLIGNLGADPEVRSTAGGTQVANASLATSTSFTARYGSAISRTQWHKLVFWGALAAIVAQHVRKGSQLYIEGELEYRSYQDAAGVTKYVTEIRVNEMVMLSSADRRAPAPQDDAPAHSDAELPAEPTQRQFEIV
jgi:single-strand DNA-binding protein